MRKFGKKAMSKIFFFSLLLLSACNMQYKSYIAEPIVSEPEEVIQAYHAQDIDSTILRDWLAAKGNRSENWPRTSWDIDGLALVGQFFSTALAVEEATIAVAEAAEITASQKRNPEIELSSEYHSDRGGGVSRCH